MHDKLVTIAQFNNYIEAEMAKQLLADYGIEAVATGENASNLYSIPTVEGPQLHVTESNAQRAREIIQAANHQQEQHKNENQNQQEQEH
ncbi:MAG: putative signal transducing protein [Planctomycetota bacterium]|jgi:hypothetical protein